MQSPAEVPNTRLEDAREVLRRTARMAVDRHLDAATEALVDSHGQVNLALAAAFYGEGTATLEPPSRAKRLVYSLLGGAGVAFAAGLTGGMAVVPWAIGAVSAVVGYANGSLGPAHRLWALRARPQGFVDAIKLRRDPRLQSSARVATELHVGTQARDEVGRVRVGLLDAVRSRRLSGLVTGMGALATAAMGVHMGPMMIGLQSVFIASATVLASASLANLQGAGRIARIDVNTPLREMTRRATAIEELLEADHAVRIERELAPAVLRRDPYVREAFRRYEYVRGGSGRTGDTPDTGAPTPDNIAAPLRPLRPQNERDPGTASFTIS